MDESVILQFPKDEISAMCLDLVKDITQEILDIQAKQDDILNDDDLSRNDMNIQIKESYEEMTKLWSKLGKARLLARKLYPEQDILFDVLDKSFDVNVTISTICSQTLAR